MLSTFLYNQGHQWVMFGRDPDKPEKIIDTNQCMVVSGGRVVARDGVLLA